MNPTKPTPAQLALIHTAQSAGISALMTLIGGVYQYVFTNGLNIPGLLSFLGIAFVACMTMMYKSVSGSPQLAQAALDTANEAKTAVENVLPMLHTHAATITVPAQQVAPVVSAPAPVVQAPFVQTPLPPQQAFPAPSFPSRFTANEIPAVTGQ